MVYRVLYETVVRNAMYYKILQFESQSDYIEWCDFERIIKREIADIQEDHDNGIVEETIINQRLLQWLDGTVEFASRFGKALIPLDVRISVHDAERMFNMPCTDFGSDVGCVYCDPIGDEIGDVE